jgi:hypothetical protein
MSASRASGVDVDVDVDELPTNVLDPLVPRPIDLPSAVPAPGDASGDIAKIFAAPDDPAEWPAWRESLNRWRHEAVGRTGYWGDAYSNPSTAWAAHCYAVAQVWLWDERLYDAEAGRFTPRALVDWYAPSGGLDGIVLWHAYPVIGIDDRNQFDFYRDVPGLRELVDELHELGLRVFVDYNPWDTGTRRAAGSDAEELAAVVQELRVDGVFLDTLKEADDTLVAALRGAHPRQVLEGESRVPLERVQDHQLSWAQWFADSAAPGVLRARWFERRHMTHGTRRWNRDHSDELQTAWINGSGMLVWDAVFGVWVGWNPRDRDTLARSLVVLRGLTDVFVAGEWEPLIELEPAAHAAGIYGSRFSLGGVSVVALVNRSADPFAGVVLEGTDSVVVPARSIAALIGVDASASPADRNRAAEVRRVYLALAQSGDADFPARRAERRAVHGSTAAPPTDALVPAPGERSIHVSYRRRETGLYDEAPYVEEWKPLPPRLHDDRTGELTVIIGQVAVAAREVSAGELGAYRGESAIGDPEEPATGVTLDEARAFATAAGARLPTEFEWQAAAELPGFERREPQAWNWTESEHSDGITRFVILKGGSAFRATGSDWYFDGGPQHPSFSAKLLLPGFGLDASPSIGFRLAWDLS